MNKIKRLIQSYGKYISVPWRDDAAAMQRVIFCVYDEGDELRLRAAVDEFEIVMRRAGHEWALFDLTDTFSDWLTSQRYAQSYFSKPHLLPTLLPKYLSYISEGFQAFLDKRKADENTVTALQGVGSIFGFFEGTRSYRCACTPNKREAISVLSREL